ncbi:MULTISPECIES: ABC transporter permease [unclassified Granulicatella]|uniref:ABC transporter permease n=1 Tax=unclassified Granulicatella TaxID=2630493 RepID=UPI0014311407|nr:MULTISPECIES: ABC transporter permease [unclassified Granulicatella]MBF0779805.1 ABC transporter permease [Granulicatella sp. 19428wC4_WM01]
MKALFKLEYLLIKRDVLTFLLSIGMPVLFFLLFSSFMVFQDKELERVVIRNYLVTMTGFSMSGFAVFTLPNMLKLDEKNKWIIHIKHLPIALFSYYTVKICRVLIGYLLSIIVCFSVGIFMKNIVFTPFELISTVCLLLMTGMVYIAVGIALNCLRSFQLVSVVGNIVYFVLAIFGGSWIPVSQFPEWMQQVAKFVPTYYTNNLVIEFLNDKALNVTALVVTFLYTIGCLSFAYVIQKRREVK